MTKSNHSPVVSRTSLFKEASFHTRPVEKGFLLFFLGLGAVLLLLAAFFDPTISKTVMDRTSVVGHFFQIYGTKGPNVVLFIAFQLLAWTVFFNYEGKLVRFILTTGLLGLSMGQILFGLNGYFGYTLAKFINGTAKSVPDPKLETFLVALLVTAALSFVFYLGMKDKSRADYDYLWKAAVMGIALVFVISLVIGDLKLHWGRFRPFQMDANFSQFTPWYHPNGANGHFSFPSGHTTSGWTLLYLPFFFTREKRFWQRLTTSVAIALAITIALSRVRYGAHWLSDVTAASMIVGSMIFAASRLLQAHFVEE